MSPLDVRATDGPTADGRETPDIETSSEDYARRFAGPVGAWFLRQQEQSVLRLLASRRVTTVLEVGGGHGQLTGTLIRHGYRVTVLGSDASCQQRIRPWVERGDCQFMVGDLLDVPYSGEAFDAVVSLRLLAHVAAWPRLIHELARVAHDCVVVDYPPLHSVNLLAPWLFGLKQQVEGNTRRFTTFRDAELASVFSAEGFACRRREPQFFWPMALHRALRRPMLSQILEAPCRSVRLTRRFGSPVIALFTRSRS